jgi:hypothetical protein
VYVDYAVYVGGLIALILAWHFIKRAYRTRQAERRA